MTFGIIFAVKFSGCFYGGRAAMPHLVRTGVNIVFTASVAGLGGNAGVASYTSSKHGVIGLVHRFGVEAGRKGVRVNGVAPGWSRTSLFGGKTDFDEGVITRTPSAASRNPRKLPSLSCSLL